MSINYDELVDESKPIPISINFEQQLNELRRPCIMSYFKNKSVLDFMKTYINIDILISNYSDNNNNNNSKSIFEKLIEINELTDNVLVKELIKSINVQLCDGKNKEIVEDETSNICDKVLLHKLIEEFPKGDLINVDHMSKYQNVIQLKEDNRPYVLIYSEIVLDSNISKSDVEKFYNDVKESNSCGILCNSNSGISNKDKFEIDIQDSNVYVFIPNHNYDIKFFKLAIQIIYHIYDIIKDTDNAIEIDKELLQRLKLEYNYFVTIRGKHLDSIKSNAIALEKLELIQLDHFFKRTHISADDKPYSCQLCGTKFGTDKSLKSHLKIKHQIQLGKKRNKKIKDDEEDECEEPDIIVDGNITFD